MAYATPADLVAKWGDTEIARLSAASNAEALVVDQARCRSALADAEALVDSHLRARYAVPLTDPPREVVLAVLVIARHELAQGDGREPTTQMSDARKEVLAWLAKVASGTVRIAGAANAGAGPVADAASVDGGSLFQDRRPTFTADGRGFV